MTRLYGRSQKNQRLVAHVPHGHWRSTSMICALRSDGVVAPFLIEGAVDAQVFSAYLQHMLGPELHPGDMVILDNLSTHKIAAVKTLIEARGASVQYLPAYSPDLNPIGNGLRQTQSTPAPSRCPYNRTAPSRRRKRTGILPARPLPCLLSPRQLWVYLIRICSRTNTELLPWAWAQFWAVVRQNARPPPKKRLLENLFPRQTPCLTCRGTA